MTIARAAAATGSDERTAARSRLFGAGISLASLLVLLGLSLLPLFLPFWMHAALDAAGSSELVGVSRVEAHALSDRTVAELFLGPGDFAFAGPDGQSFYDASEAGHLRDVRMVLLGFLALVLVSAVGLAVTLVHRGARPSLLRAAGRGGALLASGVVVLGLLALVAFDPLFELFHRLFFPGGNWAFDPVSQRLVQLYPLAFWQLTSAALGLLALFLGAATWLLVRRKAAALERTGHMQRETAS